MPVKMVFFATHSQRLAYKDYKRPLRITHVLKFWGMSKWPLLVNYFCWSCYLLEINKWPLVKQTKDQAKKWSQNEGLEVCFIQVINLQSWIALFYAPCIQYCRFQFPFPNFAATFVNGMWIWLGARESKRFKSFRRCLKTALRIPKWSFELGNEFANSATSLKYRNLAVKIWKNRQKIQAFQYRASLIYCIILD